HLWSLSPERLVGTRHPGLGISTAGALPGEELRNDHLALGGHPRGARAIPCAWVSSPAGGPAPLAVSLASAQWSCRRRGSDHRREPSVQAHAGTEAGARAPRSRLVPRHV